MTYEEISTQLGFGISTIQYRINRLINTGHLAKQHRKSRSIMLTEKGRKLLAYYGAELPTGV